MASKHELPGLEHLGRFYFGFPGQQPLRYQRASPPEDRTTTLSNLLGFDVSTLDRGVHQGTPENNGELLTADGDEYGDLMPPMVRGNGQPIFNILPADSEPMLRVADGVVQSMAAMVRVMEKMADNCTRPVPVNIQMPKQPRVKSIRRDKEGNMIGVNYSEED
jgi:hypothetical protein